jgi:signal peptidase I
VPHHGDLVLTPVRNGALMFRRVIGLPGDRVELRNFHAFINGQPEEPARGPCVVADRAFATNPARLLQHPGDYGPVAIPPGDYALVGDCRDNAVDVRQVGYTRRTGFIKRRSWILWSADANGNVRVNRIGQLVQ